MAVKSQKTPSFEVALAELEQVVADMEVGKLSLEDSLSAYRRGAELLQDLPRPFGGCTAAGAHSGRGHATKFCYQSY